MADEEKGTRGAALPVELLRDFERTFGVAILEGYGLSETSPTICFNQLGFPRKPGLPGLPQPSRQTTYHACSPSPIPSCAHVCLQLRVSPCRRIGNSCPWRMAGHCRLQARP